jgi:hypothetical protein
MREPSGIFISDLRNIYKWKILSLSSKRCAFALKYIIFDSDADILT